MNLKICILILTLSAIVLISCESQLSDSESIEISMAETHKTLEVKEAGYDLEVSLSEQELTDQQVFKFDRAFGHVEFILDENFNFILTQEDSSLSDLKKELESNALFSYKFYNLSDNELFYQCVLPDGTEMGYNLIRKTTVKGKSYIFKSNSQVEFSKEDIENAQLILNRIS